MGRPEQRRRKRKRAAAACRKLDSVFTAKRSCSTDNNAPSDTPGDYTESSTTKSPVRTQSTSSCIDEPADRYCSTVARLSDGPTPSMSTSLSESVSLSADIGAVYAHSSSHEEFCQEIQSLSPGEKYTLLKQHSVPSGQFAFPNTFTGGCNRSFRHVWLSEHPWMVYSMQIDGAFCIACVLFTSSSVKGRFVTLPFRAWQKKSEKCKQHECCGYHQDALRQADNLIRSIEHPESAIPALVDTKRIANIERNRAVLKSIVRAILFCGRQCIALRGDSEQLDTPGNPGNFLSLLKLLSVHDRTLQNHFESPPMRCVTYMSPQTQNEVIEVIGKHIILRRVVDDLKASKFYAISADEVTSHNVEHLAICARFVDSNKDIREEFLTFVPLDRITGEQIANKIIAFLTENGILVMNMRGQGYDGASNMSSERVGVQGRIRQVSPLATYVHCNGHCLNLVIAKSCSLPDVQNVLDRLRHCCLNSPKRSGVLKLIVSQNVPVEGKRKPLLDLCKTRWTERHSAYQHFYQAFKFLVEALELIGYKHHLQKYGSLYADWDPSNRTEAQQILASITSFTFIIGFMTVYQYLAHLAGITVKLQRKALDIVEAHKMINEVITVYRNEREKVDDGFAMIYSQSVRMAGTIGSTVCMPRITGWQQHRSNPESTSPGDYFKKSIAIPFLDHILSSLESQFSKSAIIASSLLGIVPSVLCSKDVNFDSAVFMYEQDLPSPEIFPMELTRWKSRYMAMPADSRPSSLAESIKDCDSDLFPNIYVLLQIACTIPVTSCECERSASALRRLNNDMHASMGKSRLSHLALLHIHYDMQVDLDEVVDCYACLHPRRMELDSLIKP